MDSGTGLCDRRSALLALAKPPIAFQHKRRIREQHNPAFERRSLGRHGLAAGFGQKQTARHESRIDQQRPARIPEVRSKEASGTQGKAGTRSKGRSILGCSRASNEISKVLTTALDAAVPTPSQPSRKPPSLRTLNTPSHRRRLAPSTLDRISVPFVLAQQKQAQLKTDMGRSGLFRIPPD